MRLKNRILSLSLLALLTISAGFALHGQADAGTAILTPDGNVQSNWTTSGTGSSTCPGHCGFINESYTTPNTTNYVSTTGGVTDEYTMTSFALPPGTTSTNSVTVYVYDDSATNSNGGIMDPLNITIGSGGTYQTAVSVTPVYGSWGWQSATFNVAWSQTQLDAMQVQISTTVSGSGKPSAQADTINVATLYASAAYTTNVTYTQAAYRWFSNWDSQVPGLSLSNPTTGSDVAKKAASDGTSLYVGGYSSANSNDWRIEKRSALDGTMTTAFGTSGVITETPSLNDDQISDITLTGNVIYAAGYDSSAGANDSEWRIESRDGTSGALNTSFGSGGVVTENPTSGADKVTAIRADSNYLYVAGYDSSGGNEWRIEKRDRNSGAPVSSFGSGGVVTENPSIGDDKITAMVVDSSYVYLAGYDYAGGTTSEIRIEKRDITTGALVSTFGVNGVLTEDIYTGSSTGTPEDTIAPGGITLSNGNILLAGSDYAPGNSEWRIESRNASSGALNSGFGTNGIIQDNVSSNNDTASAIQSDGTNIYVAGKDSSPSATDTQYRVEKRSLSTGALVSSFGSNGVKTANPSSGADNLTDAQYINGKLYDIGSDASSGNDEWRIEARNSTTGSLGFSLAAQNTAAAAPSQGTLFRLRMLISVGTNTMYNSSDTLKLQVAVKSGTCSATPSGSFSDVSNVSGDIRYATNPTATDSAATASIGDDPTDSTNTVLPQSYKQTPNFTNNISDIAVGQDGLWDFSLVNYSAPPATTYCVRAVKQDGTTLATYTNYPEITTANEDTATQYLGDHTSPLALGQTTVANSGTNNLFLDFSKVPTNTNEILSPQIELQNTSTNFTGTSNYTVPGVSTYMNLPNIRYAACSVYDSANHRMLYFGGLANDGTSYYNDVWALNLPKNGLASWSLITANGATGSPPARRAPMCAYNSTANSLVVFGGYNGSTNYNDLWSLSLGSSPTWSQLSPTGTIPAIRRAGKLTYDPVGNQMFLYAGTNGSTWYDDFYKLSLGTTPSWTQLSTAVTGQTRGDQGQLYDPVNKVIWVVGGTTASSGDLNDVWKYTIATNTWTNMLPTATACAIASPATCPMPADGASIIYDSVNQDIVWFGGYNWGSNSGISANQPRSTFILSNLSSTPTWLRTDPTSPNAIVTAYPSGRFNMASAYDPLNQRMIMFAGEDNVDSEYIKDLEYLSLPTGNTNLGWGGLPTNTVMNGHDQMMPLFDTTTNYVYEFGGFGNGTLPTVNTTGGHAAETYRLDLSNINKVPTWKNVSPQTQTGNFNPIAREAAAYAKDTKRNRLIIFGGMNVETTLNDVWAEQLNGTNAPTWTELCSPTSCGTAPPVRWLTTAVYDALNDRYIVFGGSGNSAAGVNYNDVWALTNLSGTPSWQQLSPTGTAPAARWGSAVAYDAVNQRMVIFGGTADGTSTTDYNDTWALSLGSTPAWTQLSPTGTAPTARARTTYALDTANGADKLVIFSGYNESTTTHFNDVDVLDLSTTNGAWSTPYANNCADAGAPSCRRSTSGVFDIANNRLITVNGRDASGFFNSVWAFNLTTNSWQNLNPVNKIGFSIPITGLADNAYHWQYWTVGSTSGVGPIRSYGTNNDTPIASTDFAACSPPTVSSRLRTGSYFCGLAKQNKFIGLTTQ